MDKLWRIELLGGVQLVRADGSIARFATRKIASLLAYVAYFTGRPHAREVLAELLWPEAELDAQRNSFRVALNSLRKQLEPPGIIQGRVLIADRSALRLNPEAFTTDVQLFEDAIRRSDWAEAISLYKAPLLIGWYDDWIDAERSRLADMFALALRQRTAQLWAAGEREQALATARNAVQTDPLDEENHRTLITLYAQAGFPEQAQRQYEDLEELLREELGRAPSLRTRELLSHLPAPKSPILPDKIDPPTMPIEPVSSPLPEPSPAPLRPKHVGFLPTPLTRFFGREDELARLFVLLAPGELRLLTLLGPGGVGKTRLALAAGEALRSTYSGRVWFLSLLETLPLERLLADTLRLNLPAEANPLPACIEHLRQQESLLILDSADTRTDELAGLLQELLASCPSLTCVVTSRVSLQVAGERVLPVGPLPTPSTSPSLEALVSCPSVALLLDRAQAVRPDFQLTPRNAESITQLCCKLDGWPLALELIAASAWSLTPHQMVERLERRFEVLVTEQRGIPERQKSLRAVLEAAVELLDEDSRETLPALSLFRGSFRAEQALAVVGPKAAHALTALQRQALLQTQETESGLRFSLLETVRDYASTLLAPPHATTWKAAHASHFLHAAQDARNQWDGPHSELALRFFDEERENLLAALQYSTPEQAVSLLAAAWPFWNATGLAEEGTQLLEAALTHAPDSAEAWLGLGRLQVSLGRLSEAQLSLARSEEGFTSSCPRQPTAIFQRALAARDAGNLEQACSAFQRFAEVCADDPWAVQWAERERAQLCGDSVESELPEIGEVLLELGFVAAAQGDLATGRALVSDARASFQQNGDTRLCQIASERLARIAGQQKDAQGARRATDEALALARQNDDPGAIARLMRLQWQNLRIPT